MGISSRTNVLLYDESNNRGAQAMRGFTAVIERCPDTGLYVGYVPGFAGAHAQGETLDELNRNLREVIEMLLEDGEPQLEAEFVGVQQVMVP
jgi:predicted RNase H-like HicB family nuclease